MIFFNIFAKILEALNITKPAPQGPPISWSWGAAIVILGATVLIMTRKCRGGKRAQQIEEVQAARPARRSRRRH